MKEGNTYKDLGIFGKLYEHTCYIDDCGLHLKCSKHKCINFLKADVLRNISFTYPYCWQSSFWIPKLTVKFHLRNYGFQTFFNLTIWTGCLNCYGDIFCAFQLDPALIIVYQLYLFWEPEFDHWPIAICVFTSWYFRYKSYRLNAEGTSLHLQ